MEKKNNKQITIVFEGFDGKIDLRAITNYSCKFISLANLKKIGVTTSEDYKICTMHMGVIEELMANKIPYIVISNKNNRYVSKTVIYYALKPDYYVRQTRLQALRNNNIPVIEIYTRLEEFLNKESNYKYLYDKISSLELYKFDLGLI